MFGNTIQLSNDEVDAIIQDWPTEWRVPIVDYQLSIEQESWQKNPLKNKYGGKGEDPLP